MGINLRGSANAVTTTFNTEAIPLNILVIAFKEFSVGFNFSVSSLKPLVNFASCFAVGPGNTSVKPFFTAPNTLNKLLNILAKPAIKSSLPPRSFQPCSKLFLASADFCNILPR